MRLLLPERQQPVTERLGAVVQRELTGPVAAGQRVHLRELQTGPVVDHLVVVADLVVLKDRLAERLGRGRGNDGLPARDERLVGGAGVPVRRALGLDVQHPEQAMVHRGAVTRAGVHIVRTLQVAVVRHVVAKGRGGALGS